MEIFKQTSEAIVTSLSEQMRKNSFAPGEHLFHQGEEDTALYVIISGKVKLTTHYDSVLDSSESSVMEFGPNDAVGALSFLGSESHMGSAQALTEVSAVRVTQEDFIGLRDRNLELSDAIVICLIRSLQRMTATLMLSFQEREIMLKGHRK